MSSNKSETGVCSFFFGVDLLEKSTGDACTVQTRLMYTPKIIRSCKLLISNGNFVHQVPIAVALPDWKVPAGGSSIIPRGIDSESP